MKGRMRFGGGAVLSVHDVATGTSASIHPFRMEAEISWPGR